jgi:predicted nucleic acid-binding protein
MSIFYADSSVLVKRHVREVGSQWFKELVAEPSTYIVTAEFTVAEVYSALNRRRRERSIGQRLYADATNRFMQLCRSEYELLPLSEQMIQVACNLLERHAIRAFDALHLATAVHVNAQLHTAGKGESTLLTADTRLLTAASIEGLQTHGPLT